MSTLISANEEISFVSSSVRQVREIFRAFRHCLITLSPRRPESRRSPTVTQQGEWQSSSPVLSPVLSHPLGVPGLLKHQNSPI